MNDVKVEIDDGVFTICQGNVTHEIVALDWRANHLMRDLLWLWTTYDRDDSEFAAMCRENKAHEIVEHLAVRRWPLPATEIKLFSKFSAHGRQVMIWHLRSTEDHVIVIDDKARSAEELVIDDKARSSRPPPPNYNHTGIV